MPMLGYAFHDTDSELGELTSKALLGLCCSCLGRYPTANASASTTAKEGKSGAGAGADPADVGVPYRKACALKVREGERSILTTLQRGLLAELFGRPAQPAVGGHDAAHQVKKRQRTA